LTADISDTFQPTDPSSTTSSTPSYAHIHITPGRYYSRVFTFRGIRILFT
jgi:hypothetical protein